MSALGRIRFWINTGKGKKVLEDDDDLPPLEPERVKKIKEGYKEAQRRKEFESNVESKKDSNSEIKAGVLEKHASDYKHTTFSGNGIVRVETPIVHQHNPKQDAKATSEIKNNQQYRSCGKCGIPIPRQCFLCDSCYEKKYRGEKQQKQIAKLFPMLIVGLLLIFLLYLWQINNVSTIEITTARLSKVVTKNPLQGITTFEYELKSDVKAAYLASPSGAKIIDFPCKSKGNCREYHKIPLAGYKQIESPNSQYAFETGTQAYLLCVEFDNAFIFKQCIPTTLNSIKFNSDSEPTSDATIFECPQDFKKVDSNCEKIKRCSDGTEYSVCSAQQPLYCQDGVLVNLASKCGCPYGGTIRQQGDQCIDLSKPDIDYLEEKVHKLINVQRQNNGLSTLIYDEKLAEIARKHSQDMATNHFFAHENLQGQGPTERAIAAGYSVHKELSGGWYSDGIAENIAQNNLYTSTNYVNGIETSHDWQTPDEIASSIVNQWMNSPGHRANILNEEYVKEGIGIAISTQDEVLVTEDFW